MTEIQREIPHLWGKLPTLRNASARAAGSAKKGAGGVPRDIEKKTCGECREGRGGTLRGIEGHRKKPRGALAEPLNHSFTVENKMRARRACEAPEPSLHCGEQKIYRNPT